MRGEKPGGAAVVRGGTVKWLSGGGAEGRRIWWRFGGLLCF